MCEIDLYGFFYPRIYGYFVVYVTVLGGFYSLTESALLNMMAKRSACYWYIIDV